MIEEKRGFDYFRESELVFIVIEVHSVSKKENRKELHEEKNKVEYIIGRNCFPIEEFELVEVLVVYYRDNRH